MRTALKQFRVGKHLTQEQIAEKIYTSRRTYGLVESGKRGGSQKFWCNLKNAFNVPDSEMYGLMKLDEERKVEE